MKVTFVALGCEQLSVSLLAALARRAGHEVGLAFGASLFHDRYNVNIPSLARLFDDRDAVVDAIRDQQPDVLACSALTNTYHEMLDIAREAKQHLPGLSVVFGGVHPSAEPDLVLARDEVDYVCVGEGDVAFPTLLDAIAQGGPTRPIANVRYLDDTGALVRGPQDGFIQDLDSLPFFEKEIWEDHIRIGDFYITMGSRGCPYRCTFCFNNFYARLPDGKPGKYVRQRSVDHMMGELLAAKRRYGIKFVDFEDDIFTVNKRWLREFTERYKREIGVPFQCLTHPKYMDDETARWLREAGCEWTQMGIQSVDDEYKTEELKRYETNDHVERAIEAIDKVGIKLKVDHIFGLPGEPLSAQESARRLYAAHAPARIDTFWATYFPGTEMLEQAHRLGILDDDDVQAIREGHLQVYHSSDRIWDQHSATYEAYELLFRAMPLLPRALRGRISIDLLKKVPKRSAIGWGIDLINAARNLSWEHLAYGLHYAHNLRRFAARKLGLPPPRGSTPSGPPMTSPPRRESSRSRTLPIAAA